MIAAFPAPVLSVAADAVKDLDGGEALSGLWTRESPILKSLRIANVYLIRVTVLL